MAGLTHAERGTSGYAKTRDRLEHYFDRTAAAAWERLTSDAPVSGIRATVRAGRAEMRAALLDRLGDLEGLRVLDAGCGPGDLAFEMARRGATVMGVDLSHALLDVARRRMPQDVAHRLAFTAGDMTDPAVGAFDVIVGMDSLIHYRTPDLAEALARLAARAPRVVFTLAPRTPLLTAMWWAGKAFPRSDRSPAIVPQDARALGRALGARGLPAADWGHRVSAGFYHSQVVEVRA